MIKCEHCKYYFPIYEDGGICAKVPIFKYTCEDCEACIDFKEKEGVTKNDTK